MQGHSERSKAKRNAVEESRGGTLKAARRDPSASLRSGRDDKASLGDTPPEEFREQLHRLADWIADYRANLERLRVAPNAVPVRFNERYLLSHRMQQNHSRKFLPTSIASLSQEWCIGATPAF